MSEIDNGILDLRCREVPREVYHVEGCDCTGGGELHLVGCSLWRLSPEVRRAAIDAADTRLTEHTAELNRRLSAALRQVGASR